MIKDGIPYLIRVLEIRYPDVQLDIVYLLDKLADHGEFVVVWYRDIANASAKSTSAKKLGQPFHYLLRC